MSKSRSGRNTGQLTLAYRPLCGAIVHRHGRCHLYFLPRQEVSLSISWRSLLRLWVLPGHLGGNNSPSIYSVTPHEREKCFLQNVIREELLESLVRIWRHGLHGPEEARQIHPPKEQSDIVMRLNGNLLRCVHLVCELVHTSRNVRKCGLDLLRC